jgi:hypothetical protein
LLSFLIGFPFARLGRARGDDPNHFFTALFLKRMDNQENRAGSYGSNCDPAQFIFESVVTPRNGAGIVENKDCGFKANIMLAKVPPVFALVPFKSHGKSLQEQRSGFPFKCQYICTYNRRVRKMMVSGHRHLAPESRASDALRVRGREWAAKARVLRRPSQNRRACQFCQHCEKKEKKEPSPN